MDRLSPQLEMVKFSSLNSITDSSILSLSRLKNLRVLALRSVSKFSEPSLISVINHCNNLESLDLRDCPCLTVNALFACIDAADRKRSANHILRVHLGKLDQNHHSVLWPQMLPANLVLLPF